MPELEKLLTIEEKLLTNELEKLSTPEHEKFSKPELEELPTPEHEELSTPEPEKLAKLELEKSSTPENGHEDSSINLVTFYVYLIFSFFEGNLNHFLQIVILKY